MWIAFYEFRVTRGGRKRIAYIRADEFTPNTAQHATRFDTLGAAQLHCKNLNLLHLFTFVNIVSGEKVSNYCQ